MRTESCERACSSSFFFSTKNTFRRQLKLSSQNHEIFCDKGTAQLGSRICQTIHNHGYYYCYQDGFAPHQNDATTLSRITPPEYLHPMEPSRSHKDNQVNTWTRRARIRIRIGSRIEIWTIITFLLPFVPCHHPCARSTAETSPRREQDAGPSNAFPVVAIVAGR